MHEDDENSGHEGPGRRGRRRHHARRYSRTGRSRRDRHDRAAGPGGERHRLNGPRRLHPGLACQDRCPAPPGHFTKKLAKLEKAESKAQAAAAKATTSQAKAYPDWLVKHYSGWIDRVKKEESFRLNAKHLAHMSHRASALAAACK